MTSRGKILGLKRSLALVLIDACRRRRLPLFWGSVLNQPFVLGVGAPGSVCVALGKDGSARHDER
jgi:hypothetical protein